MNALPPQMVSQLADLCCARYHSALSEGKTERAAFEELVRVILEMYREAIAS